MALTRSRVKILLNIALWFLVSNVQTSPVDSDLLSGFYKHSSQRDRPIVVVLDNNSNRNDDNYRSHLQNRADEIFSDNRGGNSGEYDEVSNANVHGRKPSSRGDSHYSSYNSRNQLRRPRYDDRNERNNRYNRNENRNYRSRNRNDNRNYRHDDINDRYADTRAVNEDRSGRYGNRNDRSDRNSRNHNRNSNRYVDSHYRHDRNDKQYRNLNRYQNDNNRDRYSSQHNRNDRQWHGYNANRKGDKPIQRTKPEDNDDQEVQKLEESILRSPFVKTLLRIADDVALRKRDSCEESGADNSCEEKKKEEDDPCEANSNSCEMDTADKNISTRGMVDNYVSDPPPKICK